MEVSAAALWFMLLLGAYHGINPGMGWLFAVALGMQEEKGTAVARSLLPIAFGHALSVGAAVSAAGLLGAVLPLMAIRYAVAAVIIGLGISFLVRHRHPRWVRMQVGFRDLTVWSFLMASAHGAGLMVVPLLLSGRGVAAAEPLGGHHHVHAHGPLAGLVATAIHTLGYLAVTGLVAWEVYSKVGLLLLRKAWLNLDLVWAAALVVTGVIALVM